MNFEVMWEAFLTRLLPIFHEVTLGALRNFHPEQYPLNALIAAIGALAASLILFWIGVGLRRMPERVSTAEQQARIETMRAGAQHWLPWLLILSPTPMGVILIIAAGFFRVKPMVAAAAIVAAEILFRLSPLISR